MRPPPLPSLPPTPRPALLQLHIPPLQLLIVPFQPFHIIFPSLAVPRCVDRQLALLIDPPSLTYIACKSLYQTSIISEIWKESGLHCPKHYRGSKLVDRAEGDAQLSPGTRHV